jgi:cytochrome P450
VILLSTGLRDTEVPSSNETVQPPIRLGRAFVQNPHELYRLLRSQGPVHRVTLWGGIHAWLVTRYSEARSLLNDPRLCKDQARALELFPDGTAGVHGSALAAHMLNSDPPAHTRLRRLVSKAFTGRVVARLRPMIERTVDDLLDQLPTGEAVDLISSFALPLPLSMISMLLGVPDGDRDKFAVWMRSLVTSLDQKELREAEKHVIDYLDELIAAKRADPGDDLLTELILVSDAGDSLSGGELQAMAFLLILAGYETTVNLIGNGMQALLSEPEQMTALRRQPDLLPRAVEEFLRFESPLNMATLRFTDAPIDIDGVVIPKNEFVMIALLSANHDPAQFTDPDRLDITRDTNAHLAFGYGIHYCLGAPLARLEGEIAFSRLLARFTTISRPDDAGPLTYYQSTLMRGLQSLVVDLA